MNTSSIVGKIADTSLQQRETCIIGFVDLLAHVEAIAKKKATIVVAISGFGGAGKSHLADKLRKHFGINENQVIRIDHLYGSNPNGPGIFDQSDWGLLGQILKDVQAGKRLCYEGKGYKGEAILCNEELPNVIIVEGIRLLQPNLMSYFDISVWIDCPQDVALERAKARDRAQGEDEQTIALWDTDWGPKDALYFDTYRPDKLASFLYEKYK